MKKLEFNKEFVYKPIYGSISGYTTTYNCIQEDYPFIESIKSALGFADEVVVVDGASTDGTWEALQQLQQEVGEDKLKLYQNEFDWTNPGVDGQQKAFSRALCEKDFLVQFDVDECFHESDYEKWKQLTKRFPTQADILHLPVIELWGPKGEVTGRRHFWKWRMSRNKPEITHSINKHARVTHPETGVVYAKEHMSDGCEYVSAIDYEMLPHVGFYTAQLEELRHKDFNAFATTVNQCAHNMPCVYHYSWFNISRKIKQLRSGGNWDKMWSLLYQKENMERFPDIDTDEKARVLAVRLYESGGEDSDNVRFKFALNHTQPSIMQSWIKRNSKF